MTADEQLRQLMRAAADALPAAPYEARSVWQAGQRRRRRARIIASAVAVTSIAGIAGGVVALQPGSERDHVASAPGPEVTPGVDRAPAPEDEARLPRTPSALPERIALDPGSAAKLSDMPVPRALALFQEMRTGSPVYVLGADGRMRVIDELEPEAVRDAGGNEMTALSSASLSPDGTKAALPQIDAVILADLTTGRIKRFPVAGLNERLSWLSEGTALVVERENGTVILDLRTGSVRAQPYTGFAAAAAAEATASEIVRITSSPGTPGANLTVWTSSGERVSETTVLMERIAPESVVLLTGGVRGTGWRRGDLVAQTVRVDGADGQADVVFVADVRSGRLVRALKLPWSRDGSTAQTRCGVGSCPVKGWHGDDTVLIHSVIYRSDGTEHSRLLAWNIRTGVLTRVVDLPDRTVVSVGDITR